MNKYFVNMTADLDLKRDIDTPSVPCLISAIGF